MFRHPLAREITIVLVAKLLLLLFGFFLFFGPQTRPSLTPEGILERFSATAPVERPDA